MNDENAESNGTYKKSLEMSAELEKELAANPKKFLMLTGDRPTGALHIGHYFGSLKNRVRLSNMGMRTFILIADYQVLTDHDAFDKISENTKNLVADYLAAGIKPADDICIYPHSQVPEANQLLIPFLTLVTKSELERNPTVKTEIATAGLESVNMGMFTYPVHQAVDILFCKSTVVPVGKDQLPHIELTRTIAKRFNEKYCAKKEPIFPLPRALLSASPAILGLDGVHKMSKSLGNAIMLGATSDETARLIKKAVTDSERVITFDPVKRPAVSNLLTLISLCTGEEPAKIADTIGDKGSGKLKALLTEALNEELRALRERRAQIICDEALIRTTLTNGVKKAREVAQKTLEEVRSAMNMEL